VSFKDVAFRYAEGEKDVLSHLSRDVKAGESIALVGPSGGGKTTLCSLIPRFYEVTSGTISVDGTDIKDVTLASLRSNIGVVQQDVYLFSGSVRENIAYGKSDATDEQIREAARLAGADEFISQLPDGYDTYVGERGVKLSGGQKQRIAIAGILAIRPQCIVLDEPTAMLDPSGREEVMSTLIRLNKEMGITVVLITHYMDEAVSADRVVVMDSGKVLTQGTPGEVFSQVELLKKHRLDVPQAAELAFRLKGCGVKIDRIPLDEEECAQMLLEVMK
jgi:ABC-type multidrug transport system fused ATPase/permease subunit